MFFTFCWCYFSIYLSYKFGTQIQAVDLEEMNNFCLNHFGKKFEKSYRPGCFEFFEPEILKKRTTADLGNIRYTTIF